VIQSFGKSFFSAEGVSLCLNARLGNRKQKSSVGSGGKQKTLFDMQPKSTSSESKQTQTQASPNNDNCSANETPLIPPHKLQESWTGESQTKVPPVAEC
jgi:hypothetical protein